MPPSLLQGFLGQSVAWCMVLSQGMVHGTITGYCSSPALKNLVYRSVSSLDHCVRPIAANWYEMSSVMTSVNFATCAAMYMYIEKACTQSKDHFNLLPLWVYKLPAHKEGEASRLHVFFCCLRKGVALLNPHIPNAGSPPTSLQHN